jgi:Protein similar to CwfJ C-terminus 1/Protein similar to CwfJ C-terminus 2
MLLAGIKAGKKKKTKKAQQEEPKPEQGNEHGISLVAASSVKPPTPTAAATTTTTAETTAASLPATNESLAEQLRQSFRQGKAIVPVVVTKKDAPVASLEDRGRILLQGKYDKQKEVIIMGAARSNQKKNDEELTIAEMVAQERLDPSTSSQNEATAREILRMNKRRKLKKNADSDEEEERQLQTVGIVKSEGSKTASSAVAKPPTVRQERQEQRHEQVLQQRAVARHDAQEHIISKCWWWMEAKLSFQRHRLLALGDYVSLVMTPTALSVTPGRHFYLVPIRHASSLLTCDEQVWLEVQQFQSSLRAMYASKKLAVLFTETVLSTSSFWQTRMECIVVPTDVALDAPLYFKNSMLEQAEEWGTHSHKIYNITSHEKTLVQTLPSKASNLAYFYVDFGGNNASNNASTTTTATTTGYAQVIESSRFPKDFAADTVAGMMHLDPMRLRRGRKPPPQLSRGGGQKGGGSGDAEEEQDLIRTFLQEWKDFDWTLQLDDGS